MRRNSLTLGLLAGLLATALAHPAPARALDADASTTTPLDVTNSCNGEFVHFDAVTVHTVARTSSDGSYTTFTTDFHGSGLGSFGNSYTISWTNITSDNTNGAQNESTAIHNLVLVSQGPAPNLISQNITHLTINADGSLTALVEIGPTQNCVG
jgi:hypothetical protein